MATSTGKVIKVDTQSLRNAATSIDTLAGDYKKQYETLFSDTKALSTTWTDDANKAFNQRIEGFKDDLDKMYKLMSSYAAFLRTSAQTYDDTQTDIINNIKSLNN